MPILCVGSEDRHFTIALDGTLAMPPHAMDRTPPGQRPPNWTASVFIIISAKAFSSVGFGLSLLAIWFGWALPDGLLPGQPPVAAPALRESLPTRKGHRRTRSAVHKRKSTSPKASRRLSSPLPLPPAPIFGVQENATRPVPARHVSFVDAGPVRRNSAPPERQPHENPLIPSPPPHSQLFSEAVTTSPVSSTSSLPTTSLPSNPPIEDDRQSMNSDTSRRSTAPSNSRPSTPVFRRLRLTFSAKRKRTPTCDLPATPELDANMELEPAPEPPVVPVAASIKRSFTPPWCHSRKSSSTDPVASLDTASAQSSSPVGLAQAKSTSTSSKGSTCSSQATSSFTSISKKSQRRISTPIPRTLPYEAPYFATPPLLLDNSYSAYLRRLPRFEDEIHPAPEGDQSRSHSHPRGRGTSKDPVTQLAPRSNGQRTRVIPKRRSASEDWSPRQGLVAP